MVDPNSLWRAASLDLKVTSQSKNSSDGISSMSFIVVRGTNRSASSHGRGSLLCGGSGGSLSLLLRLLPANQ